MPFRAGVLLCLLVAASTCAQEVQVEAERPCSVLPFTAPAAAAAAGRSGDYYVKRVERFSVLAESADASLALATNLPSLQRWIVQRWGLPEGDRSMECRVFCMSSRAALAKDFRIDAPQMEVRRDNEGRNIYALYVVGDGTLYDTLAFYMTTVTLKDVERKYGVRFSHWVYRGMGTLDCSYPRIRAKLVPVRDRLSHNRPMYFTKSVLTLTEKDWAKQSAEVQVLFDGESAVMCMMLFRECGRRAFLDFVGVEPSEQNMERVLKVPSYATLDPLFKKYLVKMSGDTGSKSLKLPKE